VNDPSSHDPLLRLLAFGHPLWMSVSIAIAVLAARSGLRMRSARRLGTRRDPALRRRHLRAAKLAVTLVAIGFAGGPLSMSLLRGRDPFETAHAWIATLALVLFAATAVIGRGLERGRSRSLDRHALVAALALLAAGAAAMTGWVLLP
jgi:phosphatidylglycerophosphate synthase